MPGKSGSESNSQTEGESSVLNTAPGSMTDSQKRIFAWRRWHGIGLGGQEIEEWTQKRIAGYLGVSERTVRRWVKEEPAPVFEGLSQRERQFLFGSIIAGRGDVAEEYLSLLSLESRLTEGGDRFPVKSPGFESGESDSRNSTGGDRGISSEQSTAPDSDPHPFAGLDEDFSL